MDDISRRDILSEKLHELEFTARLSINYHEKAESKYSSWIDTTVLMSIIVSSSTLAALGSSGFLTYSEKILVGSALAAFVALLNSVVQAFGFQVKLVEHGYMRRKWADIYGSLKEIDLGIMEFDDVEREIRRAEVVSNQCHTSESGLNKKWQMASYYDACENMGLKPVGGYPKKRKSGKNGFLGGIASFFS